MIILVQSPTGGHTASQTLHASLLEIRDGCNVGTDDCHGVWGVYKESMLTQNHVTILQREQQDGKYDDEVSILVDLNWRIKSTTTVEMFGSSFLTLLFSKDTLHWSKLTVKTFIMLQNTNILNKYCSFELSIHQRILKK